MKASGKPVAVRSTAPLRHERSLDGGSKRKRKMDSKTSTDKRKETRRAKSMKRYISCGYGYGCLDTASVQNARPLANLPCILAGRLKQGVLQSARRSGVTHVHHDHDRS
eukprot:5453358-Amphidinium_carterae.1